MTWCALTRKKDNYYNLTILFVGTILRVAKENTLCQSNFLTFYVIKKGDSDSLIFCVKLKLIQMQYVMESYSRFVNSLAKSV